MRKLTHQALLDVFRDLPDDVAAEMYGILKSKKRKFKEKDANRVEEINAWKDAIEAYENRDGMKQYDFYEIQVCHFKQTEGVAKFRMDVKCKHHKKHVRPCLMLLLHYDFQNKHIVRGEYLRCQLQCVHNLFCGKQQVDYQRIPIMDVIWLQKVLRYFTRWDLYIKN